jgi:hypothetical protein
VLSTPLGTWSALAAAVEAAAGKTATLTLSPSFTMEGFGIPSIEPETPGTAIIIEGHGATFDGASYNSFFYLGAKVSLTIRNVTMQNGRNAPGGAIIVGGLGSILTLDGCTFINNTGMDDPPVGAEAGALFFNPQTAGLIKGCSFVGPISSAHNDIYNYHHKQPWANVTFACADDEVGTPVQMQGQEITDGDPPPGAAVCRWKVSLPQRRAIQLAVRRDSYRWSFVQRLPRSV